MDRLLKLRRERERLRQARTDSNYSLLHLLKESAQAYLELTGTWADFVQSLEQSHHQFSEVLERLEDEELASVCERVLDELENFPTDRLPEQSRVQEFLQSISELDGALSEFDLSQTFVMLRSLEDRDHLLQRVDVDYTDDDLEAGRFQSVVELLESFFYEDGDREFVTEQLEEFLDIIVGLAEKYESTQLTQAEWTAEVALADELLLEGYHCWLTGLEHLLVCCRDDNEPLAWECLEELRVGNRFFLMVESLSQG